MGSTWLNPTGKVVLIKDVLSSIPIYQCSIIQASKGIIALIESLLRKFPWKGGKPNVKKIPLVSWEKVSKLVMQGGLQIRNLALGAKILWNIISGKGTWCKASIWKKYFSGNRLRCLDSPYQVRKRSTIFSILMKALSVFSPNIT